MVLPATAKLAQPTAEYAFRVRNASNILVGEMQVRRATMTLRHNNVGAWVLEADADNWLARALANDRYGIQVLRTLRDPATGVLISSSILFGGKRWGRVRQMKGNTLVANGFDDNFALQSRQAWQVVSYPYPAYVLALPNLLRYYKLNESVGTTATDSKSAINGTYNGTPSLAQKKVADDAAYSPQFDGVNDYVSAATTGLPTGNNPVYIGGWVYLTQYLVSSQMSPFWYGASVDGTRTGIYPAINQDGTMQVKSTSTSASGNSTAVVTLNTPHLIGIQYDGTIMSGWLDGVEICSFTPGTLALGTDAFQIARKASGNFMPGYIGHVFAGSGTLTADQWKAMYNLGRSRFYANDYDDRNGAAETVIRAYVDANAVSAINDPLDLSRNVPGLVLDTDGGRGSSVKGHARDDQLVLPDGTGLLQGLAQSGDVGFHVVPSGSSLKLTFYTPQDLTANVIFSERLGNLSDFTYEEDGPDFNNGGNVLLAAGGGQGADRFFAVFADTDSISRWDRFEGYIDARDTTDLDTITQRATSQLAQAAAQTHFAMTLAPQRALVYGLDFNLGDKVTIVIDGVAYTDLIREVQITLDRQGAETVVPVVGTPNADTMRKLFGGYVQFNQIANLRAMVDKLSRSQ